MTKRNTDVAFATNIQSKKNMYFMQKTFPIFPIFPNERV